MAGVGLGHELGPQIGLQLHREYSGLHSNASRGNDVVYTNSDYFWSNLKSYQKRRPAIAGKYALCRLSSLSNQGKFDNVRLTAAPEPASWAMLIASFAMVGVAARRRKTAVAA
jgi:hypothetical protein